MLVGTARRPLSGPGDYLKDKYDSASEVVVEKHRESRGWVETLQAKYTFFKHPTERDLVYFEGSPNFCEPNLRSPGATGKPCVIPHPHACAAEPRNRPLLSKSSLLGKHSDLLHAGACETSQRIPSRENRQADAHLRTTLVASHGIGGQCCSERGDWSLIVAPQSCGMSV
ncbi:hypothetical protein KOW79_011132 [Hemibagrus wyckioides]|uniref:Protein Wnt n=1 Tax=Hemibagrus wyckioides TaxID=337641 RepID=A0A9D3SHQ4_9TELE|nr:hypothetical protein KOW79_011132 [Hemibagrus wyckioides]